ncbi:unnamed protein product, partial [Prorocentrum cordatum]
GSAAAWERASWELGLATWEAPGCACSGAWDDFRRLLNWTVVHAGADTPLEATPHGERLCQRHAEPLVLASLGRDLLGLAREGAVAERHPCPAGLAAALSLCAAVASHSQQAALEEGGGARPGRGADEAAAAAAGEDGVDWAAAFAAWPHRLPQDCSSRAPCRAHLQAYLAVRVLLHCLHCLEASPWPVSGSEILDNAMLWLRASHAAPGRDLPPPWRGALAAQRAKRRPGLVLAGLFAGSEAFGGDPSGVSDLLRQVAEGWAPPPPTAGRLPPPAGPGTAARHFASIFGALARPGDFGARGPLGVRARPHGADFAGRRAGLRFFVYGLPREAHSGLLALLHGRVREATATPCNCDFGLSQCTEHSTSRRRLLGLPALRRGGDVLGEAAVRA